jgi:hypothetical protein
MLSYTRRETYHFTGLEEVTNDCKKEVAADIQATVDAITGQGLAFGCQKKTSEANQTANIVIYYCITFFLRICYIL